MANSFTPQQIEQFLQEFFDVVGARQYIGARYVPIFGRAGDDTVEWDDGAPYEPLTVVMHLGVSYVSRQYVPTGTPITDTDFWVETYRFNAQVEQYRQEVLTFQGQIDQIREDMESDYVPFPDSATYPKYGVLGQVLTTLTGGETKWEDPVTVDAEIAEPLIEAWLDAHPEATTTVQDGAITDAKINTNATIMRYRGLVPDGTTLLSSIAQTGIYFVGNNVLTNVTDTPTGFSGSALTIINFPFLSGPYFYQFIINSTASQMFVRLLSNSSVGAWTRIYPVATGTVVDSSINDNASILRFRGNAPSSMTLLSSISKGGIYFVPDTVFANVTDKPSDYSGVAGTIVNFPFLSVNEGNTQYSYQFLFNSSASQIYMRLMAGSSVGPWHKIFPEPTYPTSVLFNKKLVTAGDSYTAASFGAGNPNTTHNYGYYAAQRNGMTFVNRGIGGSIMALDKTYVDDPTTVDINTNDPFSYQRYLDIPADTDYLTLWFGINDANHTYLGTINDTTNETFYGAWNVVLQYYLTNRPLMHVGIIAYAYDDAYVAAVKEVADKWGYPVWDLKNDKTIPAFFVRSGLDSTAETLRKANFGWNDWNMHPNPQWHEFISGAFEEFLKKC